MKQNELIKNAMFQTSSRDWIYQTRTEHMLNKV